jgi:hypothetical protein
MIRNEQRDDCTGPSLVPGALLGFRSWYLDDSSLTSPILVNVVWQKHMTAVCMKDVRCCRCDVCRKARKDIHREPAPFKDCECGLYGWHTLDKVSTTSMVVGVVQTVGRALVGEHGFRAEKMEILALAPDHGPAMVRERTGYRLNELNLGVPILASRDQLRREFPDQDVSALLS